ncbi:MAG: hypothetical protein A3J63_00510 [Candidatus Moranbacteria bacterium RIFCSPHIGHO2_02_FULL_40_12b]|nr:MAG: hypothetical protein A3J63_00510 [Candidatus Moranbacteria bacterium RIFCSPHIGHO2_02_FULL_40_12b]OGI23008.1 MAG: hypothetical protein A3E91_03270 [Candidatus Moranbacteria bacterium RIFCSPHIGHO2_12_FULL_40_10]
MKKIIILLAIYIFLAVVFFNPVSANNSENDNMEVIPEKDGVYDVPGHPNLKVRVFIHKARPPRIIEPSLICDLSDPDSSSVVGATGWRLPAVWTYNLNPGSVPSSVGSANIANISSLSFGNWQSASGSKVTFITGPNTTISRKGLDGKNIIAWGRTSGSALGVTYTWYNPSTGLAVETDTIMNKKFSWSWSGNFGGCADGNSYDAQNILTHELGHWIGLDDEYASGFANNTMYGYGSKGEIKKDTLTSGDITGVSEIYP